MRLLSTYQSLLEQYTAKSSTLRQKSNLLSTFRLVAFLGFVFFGFKSVQTGAVIYISVTLVLFIAFLLSIRIYDKVQQQLAFYKALARLNQDEINFLNGHPFPYDTGKEYTDPHHPYSYDLDLFGEGGLFPYLNRASTSYGRQALSNVLLHPDTSVIRERQQAIGELTDKLEFRQHLQATGSMHEKKERELHQLNEWISRPASAMNLPLRLLIIFFSLLAPATLTYYIITEKETVLNLFYFLFLLNIFIASAFAKKINGHLRVSSSVTNLLEQSAGQLKLIEQQNFTAKLLVSLQDGLKTANVPASHSIARLSSLFNYLESVVNLAASPFLNGFFLFHIHVLFALEKWKRTNVSQIIPWLRLLGEIEALNCFGNLSYNNRKFCTPNVSATETLVASNMGHPLITEKKRINNSISFAEQRFIILTGSNMSGKSTFLRTLGINLILARSGSNVCAESFSFFPYKVHVSMRISDSLQDSESFFYAELKRLQGIIVELQAGENTFVILDEILRGTNSNDKHNGTVGLIRKLVEANACGIIATHDLTVSELTEQNSSYLSNKCFESEIINDELIFDYKLKDGVCRKLSASFLMKKMGVID
jgi:hypothetical protein